MKRRADVVTDLMEYAYLIEGKTSFGIVYVNKDEYNKLVSKKIINTKQEDILKYTKSRRAIGIYKNILILRRWDE